MWISRYPHKHPARICESIGSGPLVKKRMPSAMWSPWALPREELELARLLGIWCRRPRTTDMTPSQYHYMSSALYKLHHYNIYVFFKKLYHECSAHSVAEGCHSDVPWWIQPHYYHRSSQAKAKGQSESSSKG